MVLNFECKICHQVFDSDIGSVSLVEDSDRPAFEKGLLCPTCGAVTIDDVKLTELGQSQLIAETLEFNDDFWGSYEGLCQGCDLYLPINDLNLCDDCASKLERDLIRERDWDYSIAAFGLDASKREELRRQVIAQFGENLELIASSKKIKRSARRQRTRRKKKNGS